MKKNILQVSGAMMVEILVSSVVLSIGVVGISTIVMQAMNSNSINKDRIIATNLAREGIEAIRNIRDTNWIRYGNNKRVCWNFWENTNEDSELNSVLDVICQSSSQAGMSGMNQHPIGLTNSGVKIKSYLVVLNPSDSRWNLVENFVTFNTTNESEVFTYLDEDRTKGDDLSLWTDRQLSSLSMDLYLDNITGMYTHYIKDANDVDNTMTKFKREVVISYPATNDGFLDTGEAAGSAKSYDNQMKIQSIVYYQTKNGQYQSLELETELTDYLERDNWFD